MSLRVRAEASEDEDDDDDRDADRARRGDTVDALGFTVSARVQQGAPWKGRHDKLADRIVQMIVKPYPSQMATCHLQVTKVPWEGTLVRWTLKVPPLHPTLDPRPAGAGVPPTHPTLDPRPPAAT